MFKKILIANRGEIACRVARTARRMRIATVAVYSQADEGAPHARACDEAMAIGPPPASASYLKIERILDAAVKTGAEAVHPGYGFLSENADFAEAVEKAGLVFVGPTPKTIRAMGSKAAAKDLMEKAGVPTTPGYQGDDQALATFRRECARIGYPVLLKAVSGGGGKGMKIVLDQDALGDALASAQREAMSAFGDGRVLAEKYVARARHLEVQIVGDGRGEVVHLFERDCSVQRRHQKIIEEAPAPRLPAAVRARLHAIGVDAGKAVAYRGAGTVECLYDGGDGVYFMEMNTRLQVEHPATEAIAGLDLVEWQLRIAAGEKLPLKQSEIRERGHAFEARLYAENPDRDFAPSTGTLTTLRLPERIARVDSGVEEGQAITPHYDPMIAKIIVHGETRDAALARLREALEETRVAGLETNARFLHALASDPDFAAGAVSTRYIDEHRAALFRRTGADARVAAAALHFSLARLADEGSADLWTRPNGFRLNAPASAAIWIELDGEAALARLIDAGDGCEVAIEPGASAAARKEGKGGEPRRSSFAVAVGCIKRSAMRHLSEQTDGRRGDGSAPCAALNPPCEMQLAVDGRPFDAFVAPHGEGLRVWIGAEHWDVGLPDPLSGALGHHSAEGSLAASMPGVVTLLQAKPGEEVEAGAVLLVMEAMKMEHAIRAPHDGRVKAFRCAPGDQVKEGDLLVEFEETE
jgi:3-methylcrotonyl-CoA carboxylase alpha subunit